MIFGTDGFRGIVDSEINSKIAYDIGKGLAIYIIDNNLKKKVVVGKDTRLSSDCYVSSIASGLTEYGVDVDIVGIVSTPMVSFLINRLDYSAGIMITASHNDNTYNGIKVFNRYGEKADLDMESIIEENFKKDCIERSKGKIAYVEELQSHYERYICKKFTNKIEYGLKIVLDCANGSNYKIAPDILRKLGVNVIKKDCTSSGEKINDNCGANYINSLVEYVKNNELDFGIAFDGDGDRVRVVLSNGKVLDGDDLLLIFAKYIRANTNLKLNKICGTIMTNMGLDKTLEQDKIKVVRSDVGDKKVIHLMKQNSIILGGESSGHICFLNYLPTCDALYNALYFLKCYSYFKDEMYKIIDEKITYDSVITNVKVDVNFRKYFDKNIVIKNKIKNIQDENFDTKIIVRPSGTEPVIRVYVEGVDKINNNKIRQKIINFIKSEQL